MITDWDKVKEMLHNEISNHEADAMSDRMDGNDDSYQQSRVDMKNALLELIRTAEEKYLI